MNSNTTLPLNWSHITFFLWLNILFSILNYYSITINKIHQTCWQVIVFIIVSFSIITQVENYIQCDKFHSSSKLVLVCKQIKYIISTVWSNILDITFPTTIPTLSSYFYPTIWLPWYDKSMSTNFISLLPIGHDRVHIATNKVVVICNYHILM